VKYRDAAAFRQALEQRLRTRAGGDGARLARDRKRVVFDRLLARLNETAPDRWLLKGGFALDLRLSERARATRDVDIDWQATEEELFEALIAAAALRTDDHFTFQVERTGTPPERLGGSHRFRVNATLAGRLFDTFLLDVGLRSDPVSEHDTLTTPDLLSFADIEPVEVPAVPLERHIAEKLHAYTRRRHRRPAELSREGPDRHRPHERARVLRARTSAGRGRSVVRGARDTQPSGIRARATARVGTAISRTRGGGRTRFRPLDRTPTRRRLPRPRPHPGTRPCHLGRGDG
jgi:hypothetical protein